MSLLIIGLIQMVSVQTIGHLEAMRILLQENEDIQEKLVILADLAKLKNRNIIVFVLIFFYFNLCFIFFYLFFLPQNQKFIPSRYH